MRRLGQAVDRPQILEYAICDAPVEQPSFVLSRFDECRWKERWRPSFAIGLNTSNDHSRVVYEMVEIVAAKLRDHEIRQEGIHLHHNWMHPQKLTGEGRGPRPSERIAAAVYLQIAFSDRPGDEFWREGFLEVMPSLKRQYFRSSVGSDRHQIALPGPTLEAHMHLRLALFSTLTPRQALYLGEVGRVSLDAARSRLRTAFSRRS